MISVHRLSKRFGKLEALKSVSTQFQKGKSYALIGPNGSGKTTLIKGILGMVIPDEGEIKVNGTPIAGQWRYREQIGYMPQIGRYPDNMKIGQLLDMMRDLRSAELPIDEELIHAFCLDRMKDKRMHTLSGGTRQKVSAAIAFMFRPQVMILDEPTAGLDPVAVEVIKEKIQTEMNGDRVFIITSHILSDLEELTSQLLLLEEGSTLFDDSIEMLKDITGEDRLGKAIASIIKRSMPEYAPC